MFLDVCRFCWPLLDGFLNVHGDQGFVCPPAQPAVSRMSRCCISRQLHFAWVACCLLLTMASPCRTCPSVRPQHRPHRFPWPPPLKRLQIPWETAPSARLDKTPVLLLEMRRQIIPLCPSGCQLHRERPRRTIWGRGLYQTRVPATPPVRPGALRSAKRRNERKFPQRII